MITIDRVEYIENAFSAFEFNALQELNSLLKHMEITGVSSEELSEFVTNKVAVITADSEKYLSKEGLTQISLKKIKCPRCGSGVVLFPVNSLDGDQIGGDYKSQLICVDWKSCGYEEFSIMITDEWLEQLIGGTGEKNAI